MLALEKILASFIALPGLFITIWLIITVYLVRKVKSNIIKVISVVFFLSMYILFSGIGIQYLLLPLETPYQSANILIAAGDLQQYPGRYPVVVLGGGINYLPDGAELNSCTLQRVMAGYKLQKALDTPIIFTGGTGIGQQGQSEADIAIDLLLELGVKKDYIIKEDKARTTYENGVYVKKLLTDKGYNRVYLVTSAVHLYRSSHVFNSLGVEVIPVAGGFMANHRLSWLDYLPNRSALQANLAAVHELMGIVWYKISGRI